MNSSMKYYKTNNYAIRRKDIIIFDKANLTYNHPKIYWNNQIFIEIIINMETVLLANLLEY